MKGLLTTINKELADCSLEERILDQVFETYWPIFEKKFKDVLGKAPTALDAEPTRSSDDILTEILYTTRTMEKRIRQIEQRDERFRVEHRFSEIELIERVHYLLDKGLHPKEVAMELEGIAPFEIIMDIAMSAYKKTKIKELKMEKMPNK